MVGTELTVLTIVLSAATLSVAPKREGFVKWGPTFPPGLKRVTGTPLPRCPDSNPFTFNEGSHCCKTHIHDMDHCEVGYLKLTSGLSCCPEEDRIECPGPTGVACRGNKNAGIHANSYIQWIPLNRNRFLQPKISRLTGNPDYPKCLFTVI